MTVIMMKHNCDFFLQHGTDDSYLGDNIHVHGVRSCHNQFNSTEMAI